MAPEVLLVEDDPATARLFSEAFDEADVNATLEIVTDGVEALDQLRGTGSKEPARPEVVLLDLNLPRKDGKAVLHEVKSDPTLRRIPVVVLTTSTNQPDIDDAYDLGANAYLEKPTDFDGYLRLVRLLNDFWLSRIEHPSHAE